MFDFSDADRNRRFRVLVIATGLSCLASLLPSCGAGAGAVAAGLSSGGGGGNAGTVGSGFAVGAPSGSGRAVTTPAAIRFQLDDQEGDPGTVSIYCTEAGSSTLRPITLYPGSNPLTGIPTDGRSYEVLWDYEKDLAADLQEGGGYVENVTLQLEVSGGISPAPLHDVTLGNSGPSLAELGNGTVTPGGQANLEIDWADLIDFDFKVKDLGGADPVAIKIEFDLIGDAIEEFRPARSASTPSNEDTPEWFWTSYPLPSGKQPAVMGFRWDSTAEDQIPGREGDVVFQVTVKERLLDDSGAPILDAQGNPVAVEVAAETAQFHVDNNRPPIVLLDEGVLTNSDDRRRGIPIPMVLLNDEEYDEPRVLIQWRREGESFPSLVGFDHAGLLDLLTSPSRARERRELQIATERPRAFEGSITPPEGGWGNPVTQLRLTGLGSEASPLLARGIVGRRLEVLRPAFAAPLAWDSGTPVDVLSGDSLTSAIVLHTTGSTSWRVRQINLTDGTMEDTFLSGGGGEPLAMAMSPDREVLFVATDATIRRHWLKEPSQQDDSIVHAFGSGLRGMAALGTSQVVFTEDGGSIVRADFEAQQVVPLYAGFSHPWGIAVNPLAPNHVYVAEQDLNRILSIDLNTRRRQVLPAYLSSGTPLPLPRRIVIDRQGTRLLAVCKDGDHGPVSLRELNLRRAADGTQAGFVRELSSGLPDPSSGVATPDTGVYVLTDPTSGGPPLVIGGVEQERTIVAYDAATQVATVDEALSPEPTAGGRWRIRDWVDPMQHAPGGARNTFVWDSSDLAAEGLGVQFRVYPIDTDLGEPYLSTETKQISAGLRPESLSVEGWCSNCSPQSAVAVDIDVDGDVELVSANRAADSVVVFTQRTDPESGLPVFDDFPLTYVYANGPVSVTVADIDGNGLKDIVTANRDGNNVSILYQLGPMSFGPIEYMNGSPTIQLLGPRDVAVADLNGDRKLDIVCASYNTGELSVFFQRSGPPYDCFNNYPDRIVGGWSESPGVSAVEVGDLNGDGLLDLVTANGWTGSGGNSLRVFFQGAGTQFTPGDSLGGPTITKEPISVAIGDLDRDGDLDLVSANSSGNDLTVFHQVAPGEFVAYAHPLGSAQTTPEPSSVAVADMNGDGDLDILCTSYLGDHVALFTQSATESYPAADDPELFPSTPDRYLLLGDSGAAFSPRSLWIEDMDGDGGLDLLTANEGTNDLTVFLTSPAGEYESTADVTVAGVTSSDSAGCVADLDRDGDLDVVAVAEEDDAITIYRQGNAGNFAAWQSIVGDGLMDKPVDVTAADVTGDGLVDIVVVNETGNDLRLFVQGSDGEFEASPRIGSSSLTAKPRSVAVEDVDGDGFLDLVSANAGNDSIVVFYQQAGGSFSNDQITTLSYPDSSSQKGPRSVVVADLDRNGLADIIAASDGLSSVAVWYQDETSGFGPLFETISLGGEPQDLNVFDIDGDGALDITTVTWSLDAIQVFFQKEESSAPDLFDAGTSIVCGVGEIVQPTSIVAADLDRDGHVDLASTNRVNGAIDGDVTVFFQKAYRVFQNAPNRRLIAPTEPRSILAADIDGDGDPDLYCSGKGVPISLRYGSH